MAENLSLGQRLKRYLRERLVPSTLLGVRWMAPFVAGGGILIGLAFLFDAASVNLATLPVSQRANFGTITQVAAMLKGIGGSTFNFMLPAFAGFMAYGIAGENAFMAGFVGGYTFEIFITHCYALGGSVWHYLLFAVIYAAVLHLASLAVRKAGEWLGRLLRPARETVS